MTELEIVEKVESFVQKVVELEEKSRQTITTLNKSVILDMCYRAYGVLTNCYTISTAECFSLLSKLRFGVSTNLIKLKNVDIDELFYLVQSAHIEDYYQIELTPKERDIFRAKYIGEMLCGKLIKGD